MKQTEPEFWVLEYITITKDPRSSLVVAIGGTEKAADILQRTGGPHTAAEHRPALGLPQPLAPERHTWPTWPTNTARTSRSTSRP